jgi:Tfp pilus assembly protein PilO
MAIDMNADIGEIFKNLFAKKGADGGKGVPVNPAMKTFIAGGISVVFIILYVFFIYLPTEEVNRLKQEKISQIQFIQSEINTISDDIVKATKDLSDAQAKYQSLTKLFHTGKELDDLYRHISMLALTNQLMVSKIDKQGEEPVFEIEQPQQQANEDGLTNDALVEGESIPKKVAYYEFKVRFEISGNYANYTSFRKGLAQLKKIINIDQEKIIVLQSETKKGEVRVTAVLAIYRLPANESEKYVNSEEVLQ